MENWPKLLFTYGPFALLTLVIFVLERLARRNLKDPTVPSNVALAVYGLTWFMIFALCLTVVYAWWLINFPTEFAVRGTFENLTDGESIYAESAHLFLARGYSPGPQRYSYDWRLVTPTKLSDGEKLSVYLATREFVGGDDVSTNTGEPNLTTGKWIPRTYRYEIPIQPTFYNQDRLIRITYKRDDQTLLLSDGGKEQILPRLNDAALEVAPPVGDPSIVYAQTTPAISSIMLRLDSDDPIVRRDARRELVAQGQGAVPSMEAVLLNSNSNSRLRTGVIGALNEMHTVKLTASARKTIAKIAETADDPVLSAEANRFIYNLSPPTCGFSCGTERWIVKALADADAAKVTLTPKDTTVRELVGFKRPLEVSEAGRTGPVELQVFRVKALLTGYRHESDRDFHLVLADPTDVKATMVAEIPDPQCNRVCESKQVGQIAAARASFLARFGTGATQRSLGKLDPPVPVVVTGVGFWDLFHGQTGMAPNGLELHPIMQIEFGPK
jgi:hypothetical protein